MSLNKFMHPRNPYRKGMNFKALAAEFEEFRDAVTSDLKGNIKVNFKDPDALKALTRCALKKDFDLDVELPADRLVPTIPLRMNYLLWVEDILIAACLMNHETSPEDQISQYDGKEEVWGIDIGTGANCVFPLLGVKRFGWKFVATEVDEDSFACAQKNVRSNGLESAIKVVAAEEGGPILTPALSAAGDKSFAFTVCNPPFFDDQGSDLPASLARREQRRLEEGNPRTPPKNADTGTKKEKAVKGGEVAFVSRMIEEGKDVGDRIRVYTTMLGNKVNLLQVRKAALDAGAKTVVETQFCQGNTMRWGFAWSFGDTLEKAKDNGLVCHGKPGMMIEEHTSKKHPQNYDAKPSLTWVVPPERNFGEDLHKACEVVEELLREIEVDYVVLNEAPGWKSLEISSQDGKMPNVRHVRRARARKLSQCSEGNSDEPDAKRAKMDVTEDVKAVAAKVKAYFTTVKAEGCESGDEQKRIQVRCAIEFEDEEKLAPGACFLTNASQLIKNCLMGMYEKKG